MVALTSSTTAPPQSQISLAKVARGKKHPPKRVLLYGVEGVGKTTFAASAPKPIIVGAEEGSNHLDVPRFEDVKTWADISQALHVLTMEQHDFKTVVFDTVDWMEPLLWDFICKRDDKANVEAYGYGKGYSAALDVWRPFLARLDNLRTTKGMEVILLAHSWIKSFKNPGGDDYDRYELKIHNKAGGLLKEWADAVLFANYETFAVKDERTKRVKGIGEDARVLYTTRTAAYDAKNRFSLPRTLPLSWADFEKATLVGQDPAALLAAVKEHAVKLGAPDQEAVAAAIGRANGDANKLAQLLSWVNAKLLEHPYH